MSYKSPRFIDEHINDLIQRIRKVERRRAGGLTLTGGSTAGGVVYVGSDGNLTTDADCFFYDEDTDQLLLCDGSVSEPSYSFVSSPTTGIYLSAVDELSFGTAADRRLTISATGLFTVDDSQLAWGTSTGAQWTYYTITPVADAAAKGMWIIADLVSTSGSIENTASVLTLRPDIRAGTTSTQSSVGLYIQSIQLGAGATAARAFSVFASENTTAIAYGFVTQRQTTAGIWTASNDTGSFTGKGTGIRIGTNSWIYKSASGGTVTIEQSLTVPGTITGGAFTTGMTANRIVYTAAGGTLAVDTQLQWDPSTNFMTVGQSGGNGGSIYVNTPTGGVVLEGRSNSLTETTYLTVGRLSGESTLAIVGIANQWFLGTVSGDSVLKNHTAAIFHLGGGAATGVAALLLGTNTVGFHGAVPVAQQTITGVRHGNPALADFLTNMATKGLIVDSTTAGSSPILESFMAAKGDLITATADDTPVILGVGTDGFILTANSGVANGIEWAAPASGGHTIEEDGTPLTARTGLNFVDGLLATDDAGNDETDINADWATTEIADIGTVESAGVSTKIPRADHVHVHPSIGSGDLHPEYATDTDLSTHAAAADPHTGYRLESADHSHATTGLQGGTVSHDILTDVSEDDHHNRLHTVTDVADHTFPGGTTTFLRADGTFATPPGGGGGGDQLLAWIGL